MAVEAFLEFSVLNTVVALLISTVLWLGFRSWREERRADAAFKRQRARIAQLEELSHALPKRGYTELELHAYDGSEPGRPIVLAADGQVFNVSRGCDDFYGPGGCYMKLAGRDASRLLAKGILEPESAEAAKVPLQPFELATLRDWREHYETKWAAAPPYDSPLSTAQPALTRTLAAGRARVCRYVLLGLLLPSAQAPEEDDEDDDALVVGGQDGASSTTFSPQASPRAAWPWARQAPWRARARQPTAHVRASLDPS